MSKRKFDEMGLGTKVKLTFEDETLDWKAFVNPEFYDYIEKLEREKIKTKKEEIQTRDLAILCTAKKFIDTITFVEVEFEEGSVQEDQIARYFYGSRHDVRNEFDTEYDLAISFLVDATKYYTPEYLKQEDIEKEPFGFELRCEGNQDMDIGSDKVYFYTPHFVVRINWLFGELPGLSKVQIKECIEAVVKEHIEEPMCGYILKELSAYELDRI